MNSPQALPDTLTTQGHTAWRRLAWAWLLVVLAVSLHNGWVWLIEKRAPETDILALLPAEERDPLVGQAIAKVADAAQQHLVVLVGHRDWARARAAAAAYRGELDKTPQWFKPATALAAEQQQALAGWWAHRGALLSQADRQALQTQSAAQWAQGALRNLASPLGTAKLGAWQDDPFALFGHWLAERAAETPVRQLDGQLRVDDGELHYVLLPVTLTDKAFSFRTQQAVLPVLDAARQAALKAAPDSRLIAAGVVLHAAHASAQANDEISTIGWGSLAGIVLLMWLSFRSLWPISLVLLSLAVGTLGALSVSLLLFPHLHLITLVFGASLVGVAEDYGIHYLATRLGDRRDNITVMRALLPGLALAMLTTVVAYFGLALTPFPGLRQMAVFSGVGLVFAWLTVALWFPWLDRRHAHESAFARRLGATREYWPRLRLNRPTVLLGLCAAVAMAIGISRLSSNDDIRLLQNSPPELLTAQLEVGRILRAPAPAQFYLLRADSEQALLQREERLRQRLDTLVGQHKLGGYQAVSEWVPSRQRQQQDQALLAARLYAPSGALDSLAAALDEGPDWARATRARLAAPATPLAVEQWLASPLSEPYRHLWLGQIGGKWASIVALSGVDHRNLAPLAAQAQGLDGVSWVDKVGEVSSVMGRYRVMMGWVVLASYVAVWLLLWPRYRRHTWRVLAPTALASLLTLAVFGWLGQPLQLFHLLALLLILGMGEDYGIFLQEHPERHDRHAWLAVCLSAASTLLSFGLLGLSETPALRAFGLTMLIGIATVWLVAPCFGIATGDAEPDSERQPTRETPT